MDKSRVKIFGERNTGTRALKQMLRRGRHVALAMPNAPAPPCNMAWVDLQSSIDQYYSSEWRRLYHDALRDNARHRFAPLHMWKHAAPEWHSDFAAHSVHVIFLVRNPYSWALSMARKPYHMKAPRVGNFETFLARPWLTERRDNCAIVLRSVMHLWNEKLAAYRAFEQGASGLGCAVQFLNFENFIANPAQSACDVLIGFGIATDGVQNVEHSTKDDAQSLRDIQDYYADERWRTRLTSGAVALINQFIDWDVAGAMGYAPLNPVDFPSELENFERIQFAYDMMNMDLRSEVDLDRKAGATATA
ncbi:hypothetical protein BFP76_03440 [Amylibacter kogurei]|uniref:Sulfotransferase domain-containing protein n=1 Tax=Paramylibacter kogurei TaxID=1889778 RepID=A0A2G5K417_9RHOB|nr:hypothetical protein [Amylibacter kogurei]PIB24287.1 hypothetical protein BFP76_03440 [Amylibacter kogurei]